MPYTTRTSLIWYSENPEDLGIKLDEYIQKIRPEHSVLPLIGHLIADLSHYWKINPYFILALMIHESGIGTSAICKLKNNFMGYGAIDSDPMNKAWSFESVEGSMAVILPIIRASYLKSEGKYYAGGNLEGMNIKYSSDKQWADKVCKIMNQIEDYIIKNN